MAEPWPVRPFESVAVTVIVFTPLVLYVVVKVIPVPDEGVPPGADQEIGWNVPLPPETEAEQLTGLPAVAEPQVTLTVIGASTVSDKVTEWLGVPLDVAAVMVTVLVPRAVLALAVKETMTEHVGLHGLFVKLGVTPDGKPEAENVTSCDVPVVRVAVIDDNGLVPPRTTIRLPGEGFERLKSKLTGWLTTSEREPDSWIFERAES